MRLSSFFLISIALHATGLVYPVVFLRPQREALVPVVLFASEDGSEKELQGGGGHSTKRKGNPPERKHRSRLQQTERPGSEENKQSSEPQLPIKIASSPVDAPSGIEVASAIAGAETGGSFSEQQGNGSGGEGGTGGKGTSGAGIGSGVGVGNGPGGSRFVQVSYAYNPRPEYPDQARREGREGQVLLQVLVDEQGKSKWVEINRSSGSEALDRAAAEAIKQWRFSPARYGNKSVESWVKIPIDFRLTDAKN
jgi:periplasmic protein TonB